MSAVESFTPIANLREFHGVYDGQGFEIRNLRMRSITALPEGSALALFFQLNGGSEVKNLGLVDVDIEVRAYSSATGTNRASLAAGIVAHLRGSSTISNCYTKRGTILAQIENSANTGSSNIDAFAGGIVARAYDNTTIKNSWSSANVTSNIIAHSRRSSWARAGGIVGRVERNVTIEYTYSLGIVTSNGPNSSYAGGIVGMIDTGSTIKSSFASGRVIATGGGIRTGGIAGSILSGTPHFIGNVWNWNETGQNILHHGTAPSISDQRNRGLTTNEMLNPVSYTFPMFLDLNWDFDTVWNINPIRNDGYPNLRYFHMEVSLSSPENGYTIQSFPSRPTFTWLIPPGIVTGYHVYIGEDPNPYDPLNPAINRVWTSTSRTDTTWTYSTTSPALEMNTTYFWQVVAFNDAKIGDASPSWSFGSGNDITPRLSSPRNAGTNIDVPPTFRWYRPQGNVSGYRIYLSTIEGVDPSLSESNRIAVIDNGNQLFWFHDRDLDFLTTYYWQVVAFHGTDAEASAVFNFTTRQMRGTDIIYHVRTGPQIPQFVRAASQRSGEIIIEWEKPSHAEPDGYKIYRRSSNGGTTYLNDDEMLPRDARSYVFWLQDEDPLYIVFGVEAHYTYTVSTSDIYRS
jgi:hypothetical protein